MKICLLLHVAFSSNTAPTSTRLYLQPRCLSRHSDLNVIALVKVLLWLPIALRVTQLRPRLASSLKRQLFLISLGVLLTLVLRCPWVFSSHSPHSPFTWIPYLTSQVKLKRCVSWEVLPDLQIKFGLSPVCSHSTVCFLCHYSYCTSLVLLFISLPSTDCKFCKRRAVSVVSLAEYQYPSYLEHGWPVLGSTAGNTKSQSLFVPPSRNLQ